MLRDRFWRAIALVRNRRKNGSAIFQDRLDFDILRHIEIYVRGGAGAAAAFAGVICNIDFPPTCTKLSSRAASSAFTASFTRERDTKFPKNASSSACSMAITQSRYFDTSADSASGTDNPTPSFTASGSQRYNRSHTDPSLAL